jgi:uncharacterized protein YozE (UPF0346 family)
MICANHTGTEMTPRVKHHKQASLTMPQPTHLISPCAALLPPPHPTGLPAVEPPPAQQQLPAQTADIVNQGCGAASTAPPWASKHRHQNTCQVGGDCYCKPHLETGALVLTALLLSGPHFARPSHRYRPPQTPASPGAAADPAWQDTLFSSQTDGFDEHSACIKANLQWVQTMKGEVGQGEVFKCTAGAPPADRTGTITTGTGKLVWYFRR